MPEGTRITLTAMVERNIANDEAVISYRIEAEGKSAERLRAEVNAIAAKIESRLKKEEGLVRETTDRRMEPVWKSDKNRRQYRSGWRLVQGEQIKTMKLDRIPGWLDDIEAAGAKVDGIGFRVSSKRAEAVRSELLLLAVAKFRNRAQALAKGLDARSYRVMRLQTGSGHFPVAKMERSDVMMFAEREAAEPSLSSGQGNISVTVSGEIEVAFRDFRSN